MSIARGVSQGESAEERGVGGGDEATEKEGRVKWKERGGGGIVTQSAQTNRDRPTRSQSTH